MVLEMQKSFCQKIKKNFYFKKIPSVKNKDNFYFKNTARNIHINQGSHTRKNVYFPLPLIVVGQISTDFNVPL